MSGTSADGVDAAVVQLTGPPDALVCTVQAWRTDPFPDDLREEVLEVATGASRPVADIARLGVRLARTCAATLAAVCGDAGRRPEDLAGVGVHGQTLFHDPAGEWPVTFQAGAAAVLAEELGCTVVSDFRSRDVAAGGQGAPLVPYADAVLLRDPSEERIALNLGGIANLTWLPPGRGTEGVRGFDTGPGNMVMDALAGRLGREGQGYDRDGEGAASGRVLPDLLAAWLRHPFFDQEPPKSTGREIFGEPFLLAALGGPAGDLHLNDLLATAAELTVESVARSCERWLPRAASARRFIVSGGGVHNLHLMQRLNERLAPASVDISDRQGIPPDAKEAVAFAVLADALLSGVPANLPAVTGARRSVLLGSITPATGASLPAGAS